MPFFIGIERQWVCIWRTSVHWVWKPLCPEYGRQEDAHSAAIVESQGQVLKVWTLPQRCRGIPCSKQWDIWVPENGQQAGTQFCVFITGRELGLPTPSVPRMLEEDRLLSLLGFPITRRSSLEAILVSQAVQKFILIKYTGLWGEMPSLQGLVSRNVDMCVSIFQGETPDSVCNRHAHWHSLPHSCLTPRYLETHTEQIPWDWTYFQRYGVKPSADSSVFHHEFCSQLGIAWNCRDYLTKHLPN